MRKYKNVSGTKNLHVLTTCNRCGYSVIPVNDDLESFSIYFPYGTKHDTDVWTFDLCYDCIEEIVSTFKIKPLVHEYQITM